MQKLETEKKVVCCTTGVIRQQRKGLVDICLQMPISNHDRGKKPYPFTPSIWFMVMVEEFEKLKYIPSVQGNERQWYSHLVRALNTRLPSEYKGNTPFSVAINAQRIINEDLNFFTIYLP